MYMEENPFLIKMIIYSYYVIWRAKSGRRNWPHVFGYLTRRDSEIGQ